MLSTIKKLAIRCRERDFRVLGFESLLFSVVFGVAFHSWVVFIGLLSGLLCLLGLPKGKLYASIALSILWGFVACSIGNSSGSWTWAIACGLGMFLAGMAAHMRGLNLPFDWSTRFYWDTPDSLRADHRWRRNNLN